MTYWTCISQKLRNDTKVGLLEILKAWELLVEVLGKIEDLLRNIQNLILAHLADLDQSWNNLSIDQIFFLQLLANLEGDIDGTDSK